MIDWQAIRRPLAAALLCGMVATGLQGCLIPKKFAIQSSDKIIDLLKQHTAGRQSSIQIEVLIGKVC